jgi:hypothetical protein
MKFKNLFLFAAIAIVASCGKYEFDATQVNQEIASQQAKNQLGVDIDPNQDWMPVCNGSVSIIANADLENIARVEVLTESPFGNEDAMVLNSVECKAGQQVTLNYEAPNYLTQLVAACVSDQGEYFIKVFDIDTKVVDFQATSNGARRRADAVGGFPSTIILGKGEKSFNALRAEESQKNQYGIHIDKYWYTAWKDNSWANDMLWTHEKVDGEGGWTMKEGAIRRDVTDVVDVASIKTAVETYLKKFANGTSGTKANNWYNTLMNNKYFQEFNELTSDGKPLLLVPVQINTTDGASNFIYYYYYNPATAPTDSKALADYIKTLPKFKAVWLFWDNNASTFKREREYLLPYYGDGTPVAGAWGSPVIPKGYKVGFMNRKNKGDIFKNNSGCTYGFGELNVEVNHLIGHFFSVIDNNIIQEVYTSEKGDKANVKGPMANGMDWNSPRICMRSINGRTYLCFEEGSDLNFSDMVIEVKQGTEIKLSEVSPDVEPVIYTLCFEDRPAQADYDMNDVVLMATPKNNKTEVELRLVACGAKDKVYLKIEGSSKFNDKEIHELLGLTEEESFVNTQIGGKTKKESQCPSETIKLNGKSIMEFLKSIKIQNATTGQTVKMPGQGEAPYAIIVPMRFNYPKEGSDIRKSYPEFINWVGNVTASQDWYRSLEGVDRFPTLINK